MNRASLRLKQDKKNSKKKKGSHPVSGILIVYVKKHEQSKQRETNSNKSEREREMLDYTLLMPPAVL